MKIRQSSLFQPKSKLTYASPDDPLTKRIVIEAIERATGRPKLEKLYREVQDMQPSPMQIWEMVLAKLAIRLNYDEAQLAKIPKLGPLVFIANHPFGVVDGLILGALASRVRSKFFVLVNEVLCRDETLNEFLLPIDFRETREAMRTNIETKQKTLKRLEAGEALAIFPAGGVSTAPRKFWKEAEDLEWKRFVAQVIQKTEATVVPIYVHGRNSHLFQVASQISLSLRLSLLLNEVRNKIGREISLSIGDPIAYHQIAHLKDRQALLDYLRKVTFELGESTASSNIQ